MHGQCNARPTVTFPAAERRRPLAGTKLDCLVTEAHGCEQLAQSCYNVTHAISMQACVAVSYTHLTLPTILRV